MQTTALDDLALFAHQVLYRPEFTLLRALLEPAKVISNQMPENRDVGQRGMQLPIPRYVSQ